MAKEKGVNYWAEVDGGLRGSLLLRLGTVAVAAGSLANLGGEILTQATGTTHTTTVIAWVGYIVGLWLLAGGFAVVAYHPFFTRFAFVVGAFHGLHGIALLILLFTFTSSPIPLVVFTAVRLITTLVFAFTDEVWLPKRTQYLIIGTVSLQLIKILCRTLGLIPDLGTPMAPLLDAMLMLFISAALYQLSTVVHYEEDEWAKLIYDQSHAGFAEFNNPEHEWNKSTNK